MSKHTPGPWDWRKGELRTLHDRGEYQYGELVLHHDVEVGTVCSDADMDLIAAAPTMLKALKVAASVLRRTEVGDDDSVPMTLRTVEHAIKLAGGYEQLD